MVLVALVLLGIALANGMEVQAFVDAIGSEDYWGPLLFVVAVLMAFIGDLRRMGD